MKEWNGDVDLLDGKLQELSAEYDTRRTVCSNPTQNQQMMESLEEDRELLNVNLALFHT